MDSILAGQLNKRLDSVRGRLELRGSGQACSACCIVLMAWTSIVEGPCYMASTALTFRARSRSDPGRTRVTHAAAATIAQTIRTDRGGNLYRPPQIGCGIALRSIKFVVEQIMARLMLYHDE